jgi:hypothetical protein
VRHAGALLAVFGLAAVSGCGAGPESKAVPRAAIERYLGEVEPIRRAVNALLEGADPILRANADARIDHRLAAARMGALERRFAAYAVQIAAVDPPDARLRTLNVPYADTYVLEDSYLSALSTGLAENSLDDLPDTQDAQRATIIRWRTHLTVLAEAADAPLPADLQQAGRGEIAPSPGGS